MPGPGDRIKKLKARRKQILSTSAGGQGGRPRAAEDAELKKIDAALIKAGHKPKPYSNNPNSFGSATFGTAPKGTKSYRK